MNGLKIIDISQYNTVADLERVTRNCDGVIIRLGIRGYSAGKFKVDGKFAVYVQRLISLGVPWGVYFVTQAISAAEAEEEAVYCIRHIMMLDRTNMTLGVWCDSEYSNTLHTGRADCISKEHRTEYANAFCCKLILSGYKKVGVYCSESWANTMIVHDKIKYPFWIAKYGTNNGKAQKSPSISHDIWQYTSRGSIPGIKSFVDISFAYKIPNDQEIENGDSDNKKNPYQEPTYTLYRYRPFMGKEHVKWLQYELNEMGYGLAVDGLYGKATDAALRDAQKRFKIAVDGKCGPATRKKLKSV